MLGSVIRISIVASSSFFLFDARVDDVLLLELVVEVCGHGVGTDLRERLDVVAVKLGSPIIYSFFCNDNFFPRIKLALFFNFWLLTHRGYGKASIVDLLFLSQ